MVDILDDFLEEKSRRSSIRLYLLYSVIVLLLMNGSAYLQMKNWVQFTPIFGKIPGMIAMACLFLSAIVCFYFSTEASWFVSFIAGFIITILANTAIFQMMRLCFNFNFQEVFPFWTGISIGHVLFSLLLIEFVARLFFRYRNK